MEYLNYLSDDEDMLELLDVVMRRRRKRKFRYRVNHFLEWNNQEFVQRFRLSKDAARFVLELIEQDIAHPTTRNNAVSAELMLLATLRFFATGSFLQVIGDLNGLDKSTICRFVYRVSRAIAKLYGQFIKMPTTQEEMRNGSSAFFYIARFPKCVGAIDCSHVKISSPGGQEAEVYRNRKNFFSMNVQAICDAKCMFQDIVCRWPGSCHDSTIFQNSAIRAKFENGQYLGYVLVGDGGYANKSYLITPLRNPVRQEERRFNFSQIRTRNPIERTFGIWKRRFPILAFGIRLKSYKIEAIVIATAVLHNIAILFKNVLPSSTDEEILAIRLVESVTTENLNQNQLIGANNAYRDQLINEYFLNLQ